MVERLISYIKGELVEVTEDILIIENNQMGYEVRVPTSVANQLPPMGSNIKIYTYLYVREDIFCLYGFLNKDDLEIFRLLITVNGIGPKVALGILSTITPDVLRFAILSDDIKEICKAPGIGKKTASKLILDLKDKITLEDAFDKKNQNIIKVEDDSKNQAAYNEAIQALVALGYSNTESLRAVRNIEITSDMTTEDILKLSLKKITLNL